MAKKPQFTVYPVGSTMFSVVAPDGVTVRCLPDREEANSLAFYLTTGCFCGQLNDRLRCPRCKSRDTKPEVEQHSVGVRTIHYKCGRCAHLFYPAVSSIYPETINYNEQFEMEFI